jgi:hypothetical protein
MIFDNLVTHYWIHLSPAKKIMEGQGVLPANRQISIIEKR